MKKIHKVIADKENFIAYCKQRIRQKFHPKTDIGIVYLNNSEMQQKFNPFFEEMEIKAVITKVWVHFMRTNSYRQSHQHEKDTGLYYLLIPPHSAKLKFEDTDEIIDAIEDDFMIFPKLRPHSITTHTPAEDRLAVAMELEYQNG